MNIAHRQTVRHLAIETHSSWNDGTALEITATLKSRDTFANLEPMLPIREFESTETKLAKGVNGISQWY